MDKQEVLFSNALITLFKGVVSQERQTKVWNTIVSEQNQIRNYVARLGLDLVIQKQDGCAYLIQRRYEEEEDVLPRLITRRQLGFVTSLLLVTLRKEYTDINRSETSDRIILSEDDIIEKIRPYMADSNDEVKQTKTIVSAIKKIVDMGFIQALKSEGKQYEILPIIRGFVDAQWLEEFDQNLKQYRSYHETNKEGDEDNESV